MRPRPHTHVHHRRNMHRTTHMPTLPTLHTLHTQAHRHTWHTDTHRQAHANANIRLSLVLLSLSLSLSLKKLNRLLFPALNRAAPGDRWRQRFRQRDDAVGEGAAQDSNNRSQFLCPLTRGPALHLDHLQPRVRAPKQTTGRSTSTGKVCPPRLKKPPPGIHRHTSTRVDKGCGISSICGIHVESIVHRHTTHLWAHYIKPVLMRVSRAAAALSAEAKGYQGQQAPSQTASPRAARHLRGAADPKEGPRGGGTGEKEPPPPTGVL